jgi:hypothetical protein
MSEKLLKKIVMNELHMVRFICRSDLCGAVTEVQISRLPNMLKEGKCPVCQVEYLKPGTGIDLFLKWKAALVTLANLPGDLMVELVVPANCVAEGNCVSRG